MFVWRLSEANLTSEINIDFFYRKKKIIQENFHKSLLHKLEAITLFDKKLILQFLRGIHINIPLSQNVANIFATIIKLLSFLKLNLHAIWLIGRFSYHDSNWYLFHLKISHKMYYCNDLSLVSGCFYAVTFFLFISLRAAEKDSNLLVYKQAFP